MALLSALVIFSCTSVQKTEKKPNESVDPVALNYEKGVVKFWELDGCQYLIETANGKKLNPGILDTAYAHDGLKVWIRYKQVDRMNICMSGITVDIIDIKKRYDD